MKNTTRMRYLRDRMLASDPGRKRLNQAGKAVISLMSAVFTIMLILSLAGESYLTPSIMAGVTGMLGIMVVMDDTKEKKKVTTLLLSISASAGVTLGSLLAWNAFYVSSLMIVIIFSAFYFSHYGSRYFSLSMLGFITVYFSSFLGLSISQLPWFFLAIAIGLAYAYLYNFIVFKDSAQLLKRSMQSFHRQANLSFQLLTEMIEDPETDPAREKKLVYNVNKLKEYASNVSTDLHAQEVEEIWPGLNSSQLKLYVFDTAMFVETLADSLKQLKRDDAFEKKEIRKLLTWAISSLQKAEVLAPDYQEENLEEARQATTALRLLTDDLFHQRGDQLNGWIYLIRRIESIARHVTEGAGEVQQAIQEKNKNILPIKTEEQPADEEENEEKEEGLRPTTKKAFQALIAGTIAIVTGYIISPIQPYWVVLTTFIVLLGTVSVGRVYAKGMQRSIGTVLGAIAGFGLAKVVSGHSIVELFLLFAVLFLAFYFFTVSYTAMSLFITMLIAFLYDLLLGGISFELLSARVIDTVAGAAIAVLVSAVILPTKTRDKTTEASADYLEEVNHYVTQYIRSFLEPVNKKELAGEAFKLDEKLTALRTEANPILQWPGISKREELARWLTIFNAINYYAKHLVASSYQKEFIFPKELNTTFSSMIEKFHHNTTTLAACLQNKESPDFLYHLNNEREQVERLAPSRENEGDLIHHLYFVWKINKSLLRLGQDFGLEESDAPSHKRLEQSRQA